MNFSIAQSDEERFWETVFGDLPPGLKAAIARGGNWFTVGARTFPGKTIVNWQKARADIYVRVSLVSQGLTLGKHRGTAAETQALVGLWVDLDYGDHGHGKHYPPDLERALMILESLPCTPSVIVHTGRGLHGWWLFREPWVFTGENDQEQAAQRASAARLAEGWQAYIRDVMAPRGWALDSTANLDRVLRLPGTFNHKYDDPLPCTIHTLAETRYNPSDFEAYILPATNGHLARGTGAPAEAYPSGTFTINLDPTFPPALKLERWMETDAQFKQTWQRKRKDLKDPSASGYDLALADRAVCFHCTDQEIVDLCIAWRIKHDELEPDKVTRVDTYWRPLIAKARAAMEVTQEAAAQEATLDRLLAGSPSDTPPSPDGADLPETTTAEKKWWLFREWYIVPFKQLICQMPKGGSKGHYYAILDDGRRIEYGGIENLRSQKKFLDLTLDVIANEPHNLRRVKEALWEKRYHLLLSLREVVETSPESEGHVMALEWLNEYSESRRAITEVITAEERWREIKRSGDHTMYVEDRYFYFRLDGLREWLLLHKNMPTKVSDLSGWLKSAGVTPKAVGYKKHHKETTMSFWFVSCEVVPVATTKAAPV